MVLGHVAVAQQDKLHDFYVSHEQINKVGMITLGGWAVGNIAVNSLLLPGASGQQKYFYQMNTYWNVVNLAIAGYGYYAAVKGDAPGSLHEIADAHHTIQKILLLNAGLDVAYVMTGLFLKEAGKNSVKNGNRLKGFGNAVLLQGGFLLIFDIGMYLVHQSNGSTLQEIMQGLSFTGDGIGYVFRF